ncbi:uncharacterized protein KY384_001653 [Bacidia gigantensis]|uniref:uncharacterized protein n=1 Tax=Bacidia gigantensis TaxID=2732470 RepID=UPI001D047823|nr:uncharacterized protein KY384_001653 [Bacidia gigantensis]KAG8533912.1 hypothetical protein KY384_001653 [Bacidia gigantensis]
MAGGAKKATKKFQKNHLKDTLDNRKEFAKTKQRQQLKAKKKARHAIENGKRLGNVGELHEIKEGANGVAKDLSKMSVDEFFQGGFEVPETKKGKARSTRLATGKRKRGMDGTEMHQDNDGSGNEQSSASDASNAALDSHKQDLEALAEKDPEFYEFLKQNDSELLDFENDGKLLELSEDEEGDEQNKKIKKSNEPTPLSKDTVERWRTAMNEQNSLNAMRQIVLAFRAAAFINSDDGQKRRYTIPNSEVYHDVLITALQHVPSVVNHHIAPKETVAGRIRVATDSKKFRTLTPFLNSFSATILHLLSNLSDAPTIRLTLSSLIPLLPCLLSFKKILKTLIKTVVNIYASSKSKDEATLVTAFLLLHRLAVVSDPSIRESVLKETYQGLVKGSRVTNAHTLPSINLMKNSCVGLWGVDLNLGYTTGFSFIRQLAIHLRSSIAQPTKDSYKKIYNWQYIHSLDFWSRILSTHCNVAVNTIIKKSSDSPLHPLIYPLVQVTLGTLRLIPTPIYFPLRFHLTRSLLRLSRATTTYIPMAPSLLEVLQSPELSKPPHPSTLAPLDFTTTIRAPKSYLRTRTYQDGVGQQCMELLAEFFGCWAKSIAFPELIIPPTVMLKRWLKTASASTTPLANGRSHLANGKSRKVSGKSSVASGNKNQKFNASISLLLDKMNQNAAFIEKYRKNVSFGPGNRDQVDDFLRDVALEDTPMGAFVDGLRARREEKEKLLERGRREEDQKREEEKDERERERSGKMDVDDDDEEAEEEGEGEEVEEEIDGEMEIESEDD